MEGFGLGPSRQLGYGVYLSEQAANDFTGVVTLAEPVNLRHRARQRVFRLGDRHVGVVLPLLFQAVMMLEKFLAKELRETLAGPTAPRPGAYDRIDAGLADLS